MEPADPADASVRREVTAMMWYWSGGGVHWWGWFLSAVAMVLFWGLVIWLVVGLARGGWGGRRPPWEGFESGPETAEDILRRRFAAGEIDEEEFHRRLDVLHGRPRAGAGQR